jgi:hypothetical protein
LSVPDLSLPWVPINGVGPQGPKGPQGDQGSQGQAASLLRVGVKLHLSADLSSPGGGWVQLSNWYKAQLSGDWGSWGHVIVVPTEGWYAYAASVYWSTAYAGGTQKQTRMERNGSDSPASGEPICGAGQQQGGGLSLDDIVKMIGVAYFNAGDGIRIFAYNANDSTEVIQASVYTYWGMARIC